MLGLPEIVGPYPVGATTFVVQAKRPLVIGSSRVRGSTSAIPSALGEIQPALKLEEIAFTAFYPAQTDEGRHGWLGWLASKPKRGLDWLIRPIHETLEGYHHFGGTPYPAWLGAVIRPALTIGGSFIKIPVYVNAPLLAPEDKSWPLVIFSHGLSGSRTTYSHICQRMASTGRVVLAIEHRDGSGPAVFPRSSDSGQIYTKYYIKPEEVIWPPEMDMNSDPLRLRDDQLEFRRHEIYAAYSAFKVALETPSASRPSSASEASHGLRTIDGSRIDWASWYRKSDTNSLPQVNCDDFVLTGHSFGGATVFSVLSHPPPSPSILSSDGSDAYQTLPIRSAVIQDPWLEPIPDPGPVPYQPRLGSSIATPKLLVLQSEGFTLWRTHFERLRKTVKHWKGGRVLTLVRAQHISFSDFPLLIPDRFNDTPALPLAQLIDRLVLAFLDGKMDMDNGEEQPNLHLGDEMQDIRTRPMEVVKSESRTHDSYGWKDKLVGEPGDVVVH
ncbi:hypothetical protein PUNSTDRAFT_112632 [Punctularia strigosozonata HHB-11173 SS5]|uniref:uncharacterized protein n=1 Tax=Punctularia strigosozonata (strain HHB-11173) TaxID=741275 RepID=UPI000441742A|nr:uncharacterized protein PUNSTDRAFT_112632 [Punctularia strigosozonata HHB-11173 SS5]EIN10831.1 hypothetical protein PUNSTDRAFT_112632 [Punctularia strigosozonata HHB-11173 SS5]